MPVSVCSATILVSVCPAIMLVSVCPARMLVSVCPTRMRVSVCPARMLVMQLVMLPSIVSSLGAVFSMGPTQLVGSHAGRHIGQKKTK